MMEKEVNKQQMDELIREWTDGSLAPDIDKDVTDSFLNFIENDDSEMEVNELLDLHIHQLAIEESKSRRRKWRILVTSVAAASVVILVIGSIFLSTREHGHHTDTETIALEKTAEETPAAIDRGLPKTMAEASYGRIDHSSRDQEVRRAKKAVCHNDSTITKTQKNENAPIHREEGGMNINEVTPEIILAESLAEINAGLVSMADNTKECLSMTNASKLPVSHLTPDDNETNIIETNLINALYEIRNLNVELNFETDNKTTEI